MTSRMVNRGWKMNYFEPAFDIIPIIVIIMFVLVISFFIFVFISGIRGWHQNNKSPVLSVLAKVVAKRTEISGSSNMGTDGVSTNSSSTWYYTTFEVESGDRMEFSVQGKVYGLMVEGDRGKLTFQGTRFLEFERE